MSSVSIVTIHGQWNFGNRLQNYAVSELLSSMGYVPTTLVFRRSLYQGARDLVAQAVARCGFPGGRARRLRRFQAFDKNLNTRRILFPQRKSKAAKGFDWVVVGSDQVWNPNMGGWGRSGVEFGRVGCSGPVVSLAASFGVSTLTYEDGVYAERELRRLDAVSVRERSGVEIVRQLTGTEPVHLCDPTLALSPAQWRDLSSSLLAPSRPYALIYVLGDKQALARDAARALAGEEVEIAALRDPQDAARAWAGPQDFLGLVDAAEVVVTDSYHATIFAALFGTRTFLIERTDQESMASRFETLKSLLGIDFRPCPELPGVIEVLVDRAGFEKCRLEQRERMIEYIRSVAPDSCPGENT